MRTLKEKFEQKFRITPGCWIWTASTNRDGYGHVGHQGKVLSSHRVAYQLYIGVIAAGLCVCHKCDNRKCVNPDHLFEGSHKDNAVDRDSKARGMRGSRHTSAKLNESDIPVIRSDPRTGEALAAIYGVSSSTIYRIRNKELWKHL